MSNYVVKKGDNLIKIARANNMSLQDLIKLNPQIKDSNKISIGQQINVNSNKPARNYIQERKDWENQVNQIARENPMAALQDSDDWKRARQVFTPETWNAVREAFVKHAMENWGVNKKLGGRSIDPNDQFRQMYDKFPAEQRAKIPVYSKDADVLGNIAAKSIGAAGAAVAGAPVLSGMVKTAIANPLSTLQSLAGSAIGGELTDKAVEHTTDYSDWGDMMNQKYGMSPVVGDLTNPGAIIGGFTNYGVNAIRNSMRYGTNRTISRFNGYMADDVASRQAAAAEFNASNKPVPASGGTTSVKVNGQNRQLNNAYGVAEGKGVYYNPETGVRTRVTTNQVTNKRPQASYSNAQGNHLNHQAGQRVTTAEQWMTPPPDYVPYATTPYLQSTYAYMPHINPRHDEAKASIEIVPPIPYRPVEVEKGGESFMPYWGSIDFQKWYAQQEPGTIQKYNGKDIKIEYGQGENRRRRYTPQGYQIKGHEEVPFNNGTYYKQRTAETWEGLPVDSTATKYEDLPIPERKRNGGKVKYLNHYK